MSSMFSPRDLMWPWFLYIEFLTAWSSQGAVLEKQMRHNSVLARDASRRLFTI